MANTKKICFIALLFLLLLFGNSNFAQARNINEITDWYIDNFESNIAVNKDSSLLITENITADCGNLPDKHGIFRVLPTVIKTDKGVFKTPVELVSITDFNGKPHNYQTIKDNGRGTVTWKIGDPDITVQGKNYYRIIYKVKNAIRTANPSFDELYWNLSGNFWDIEIDKFSALVVFPSEITKKNTEIYYYTGYYGSKNTELAVYSWTNSNAISLVSTRTIQTGEGITISVTFPKNIVTPYQMTFFEKYAERLEYLFFLIPLIIFIFCFTAWEKFGKDPKMKNPIPPEFGIPENITPIQMGMVLHNGVWRNNFVTAAIINLAVKKYIKIEEIIEQNFLGFEFKDYKLTKTENYGNTDRLTKTEKKLIENIFKDGSLVQTITINGKEPVVKHGRDNIKISDLKNEFAYSIPSIKKSAFDDVVENGWLVKKSSYLSVYFFAAAALCLFIGVWAPLILAEIFYGYSYKLLFSFALSFLIFIFFGIIMPKRTLKGVDLLFKIKGFELYMKQAENYRQQFYEKENIFDKFLPYAMIFGITGLWIKKVQDTYGKDYFTNYHPSWLVGTSMTSFNIDGFTSKLNSITSSISSSTSSSSGSSGGGGSGGGGGGGGGGGW